MLSGVQGNLCSHTGGLVRTPGARSKGGQRLVTNVNGAVPGHTPFVLSRWLPVLPTSPAFYPERNLECRTCTPRRSHLPRTFTV